MGYSYGHGHGFTWKSEKRFVASSAPAAAPVNTVLPVISGTPTVGQTISTTTGTWTGSPTPTYTYQWKRAGASISGATASTYTLVALDTAALITVTVTATNASGSASATSASFGTINLTPSNAVVPVASGSLTVGSVLTSTTGTWAGTPVPTYAYQWKRDSTNVGTNASTYTLVTADIGAMMTCVVTGTNTAGSANAISNSLGPIVAAAVGGAALLITPTVEADGWATDFLYATDANRVALKVAGVVTNYAVDSFISNVSLSPKLVFSDAHNLLQYSSNLENALWLNDGTLTVTANAIAAPDGTTTADKLVSLGAVAYVYQTISTVSGSGTYSVYAKAAEIGYIQLVDYDANKADVFNLLTGTIVPPNAVTGTTTGNPVIQSVGNGWYRCSILVVSGFAGPTYTLMKGDGTGGFGDQTVPAGQGLYLWGAQVNLDTTPTSYVPTVDVAAPTGVLVWVPHNMFLNSASPATQSVTTVSGRVYTVSIVGSGSMTGSSGASGVATEASPLTFTASGTTSTFTKAGTVTQIQMNRGTVATAHLTTTSLIRCGVAIDYDPVTHALKGLLYEPEATNLCLRSNDLTNASWTKSNLTTALTATGPDGVANSATTITASAANATALQSITSSSRDRITSVFLKRRTGTGNVDLTQNNGSTWTTQAITSSWARYNLANVTTSNPTVGIRLVTSGDAVDVALFMHEIGALNDIGNIPTSPIPTLGATVLRSWDEPRFTTASINYSATAGSWYVDIYTNWTEGGRVIGTNASGQPCPLLQWQGTNRYSIFDGSVTVDKDVTSALGAHKIGLAYASADRAITADGLAVTTNSGAGMDLLTAPTLLGFGHSVGGSANWSGYIRKVRYLPRRKANADLVTETT